MSVNRKILLAGIDLDGTLLRDDKTISKRSLDAIQAAHERGIYIVPITGRPMSGVPDFIKQLDAVKYIVTSNGAYITDIKRNKILYSKQLKNSKALEYIKLANDCGLYCEAFCNGYGYVDKITMKRHEQTLKGTPLYDYVLASRCVVDDVYSHFKDNVLRADEIFCIAKTPEQREQFKTRIITDSQIQFCELADVFIELTDCEVDKGRALLRLCEMLNIPIQNTIAFGDGENDLSFMKSAGVSVAMGNAVDEIKNSADLVTLTNQENGVAEILNKL